MILLDTFFGLVVCSKVVYVKVVSGQGRNMISSHHLQDMRKGFGRELESKEKWKVAFVI